LVLLGLVAAAPSLGNGFVHDDLSIIVENPAVHSVAGIGRIFTSPYWPEPYPPANYRPLSTTGYAVQWVAGGGRPVVFRVTSVVLSIAAGLALFRLAGLLGPRWVAWLVAALFLVHPLHVEAVALAVNQSELAVGLLAAVTVAVFIRASRAGPLSAGTVIAIGGLYLAALLFKESGLVLAGLLLAAAPALRPARDRPAGSLRPLALVLGLVAAVVFVVRSTVLRGDLLGTPVAETLKDLSIGERALTMLTVVPHWWRLLLWPADLSADYSPSEIVASTGWGPEHFVGLALISATALAIALTWRRLPVVAFGLAWVVIGIFPVSNVLAPTGVVLAERTLFLPSMGIVLAAGGVIAALVESGRSRLAVAAAVVAVSALIALGVSRGISRYRVWRDPLTLWRQTTIDAPRSARAHHALAQLLFQSGARREADGHYQLAVALAPTDWAPAVDFADRLREAGMCGPAAEYYRRAVRIDPRHESARSKLILCLLQVGEYAQAGADARDALARASRPETAGVFRRMAELADSAAAARAAPGTVRFTPSR
jgi:hypothetical protein